MTLPELLIGITLTGLLVGVLAASISVILHQKNSSNGRTNNARAEQGVGVWMPADLASASDIDKTPGASPCAPSCPAGINVGGSNALMLSWDEQVDGAKYGLAGWVTRSTKVSYRYVQIGSEYVMLRVECVTVAGGLPTCKQNVVVHDLQPPLIGHPWTPGQDAPDWVIQVTDPPPPDAVIAAGAAVTKDPLAPTKNAQRVIVTINGGGDISGSGGGQHQINLTAGGTTRTIIPPDNGDKNVPTFTQARSRCGGNIALVADTSGSIGATNMAEVRKGVAAFVKAFAGTPVKIELVDFATTAQVYGSTGGGTKYYDMLSDTDVSALLAATYDSTTTPKDTTPYLVSNYSTNWEDAIHRIFRSSTGAELQVTPDMIVFFTDGVPTEDRRTSTWAPSAPANPPASLVGLPAPVGQYDHEAWYRANALANQYRGQGIRWIGVGVGDAIYADPTATYVPAPATPQAGYSAFLEAGNQWHPENFARGFHWNNITTNYHWENVQRGFHTGPQRSNAVGWQRGNNVIAQIGNNNMTYWQRKGGTWKASNPSNYLGSNTTPDDTDGWKVIVSATPTSWTTITFDQYANSNTTSAASPLDGSDGFRLQFSPATPSSWNSISQDQYDAVNSVAGPSDNFRTSTSGSSTSWTDITQAEYNTSNTTADDADGFRVGTSYTAPYDSWEVSSDGAFVGAVSGAGGNPGIAIPAGWKATAAFTAPFSHSGAATEAAFVTANPGAANNASFTVPSGWTATVSYTSPYTQWSPVSEATYKASNPDYISKAGWRYDKVYSAPFTHSDWSATNMANKQILARFVTGTNSGTEADATFSNADTADMYVTKDWTKFADAMKAIALSQCGGTVTLQTKVDTGGPALDQFTYQHTASVDPTGTALKIDKQVVVNSQDVVSGTFDFSVSGAYLDVEISQVPTGTLDHYTPVASPWSCRVGGLTKTFTVPADGSTWPGVKIQLKANEAVSCTQTVHRKP